MIKVMITGAYGLVGGVAYRQLAVQPKRYDVYGLARRRHLSARTPDEWALEIPEDHFVLSDLSDLDELTDAMAGMDVVVHMAANPRASAPWESIASSNVHGAYHVFEACRRAGVARLVFASTIMVSWGYREVEPYKAITEGRYEDVPGHVRVVTVDAPPQPRDLYACSKLWAENLGRYYAARHDLSCLGLRIGWVVAEDRVPAPHAQPVWCSQRDIAQLIERCINAPESLRFDLFYGVSNSRWRWVDIEHAREAVGYEPQDWAEDHPPR
jgi:nucleoside-diphosphate-sugar epimerase